MPQHDLVLDNGSGAAFRGDANNALAALGSTMKGPNAPPAPIAGMMWLDDDTPSASVWTLKLYDGADWISIATFDISANTWAPVIARLALGAGSAAAPAYSFSGDTDSGIYGAAGQISFSIDGVERFRVTSDRAIMRNAESIFMADKAASGANSIFRGTTNNSARWDLILGNNTAESGANAGSNLAINRYSDAGAYLSTPFFISRDTGHIGMAGPVYIDGKALQISRGTEVVPTGVSFVDFTGVPAGVRRITIMFDNLSFVADNTLSIQLGDAGGIETTGYVGNVGIVAGTATGTINASSTSQFSCFVSNWLAAEVSFGVIELLNMNGNKWIIKSKLSRSGNLQIHEAIGAKILSDVLDRVRVKSDGSNFDAGAINIFWES